MESEKMELLYAGCSHSPQDWLSQISQFSEGTPVIFDDYCSEEITNVEELRKFLEKDLYAWRVVFGGVDDCKKSGLRYYADRQILEVELF